MRQVIRELSMQKKIVAIMGSYRRGGTIDKAVGATSVRTLFIGLAAQKPRDELSDWDKKTAAKLGRWLVT